MTKSNDEKTSEALVGRFQPSARNLVLLSVGFGCLIGFARICSLGYWGYLAFELSATLDAWYALRAGVELAVFAALAVAGWTRRFGLDLKAFALACACAIASAIAFAVDATGSLGALVAVLGGGSMAVLLYAWMLLLSRFPVRMAVTATVAGLVLAGAIVEGLPYAGYDLALVGVVASAFVAGAAAVMLDPDLSSCRPDGPLDKVALARIPWFTVAMFVACEFFASVLYGVSEYMTWLYDWQPNLLVFELAAVAGVASTVALVLRSRAWMHVVWMPLFALLACAFAFSCLPARELVQVAVGFMMASVFCANFLMWVVFPALFASLEVPRAFPVGVLLVLGNSALASLAGDALGSALPRSMQNLGSVAGLLAIAICVVFAVAFAVSRRRSGAVGVFGSTVALDGGEAVASPEGQADVESLESVKQSEAAGPADSLKERLDMLVGKYGLTPRETEVAFYTVQGFSCAYIADKLVVSNSTVRFHQQNIYRKFEVHSRNELIEFVSVSA